MYRLNILFTISLLLSCTSLACSDSIRKDSGQGSGAQPIDGRDPVPNYEPGYISTSGSSPGNNSDEPDDLTSPGKFSRDSDGDGLLDLLEDDIGLAPDQPSQACGIERVEVELIEFDPDETPIDFIFIVDTSGSMIEELPRVELGITSLIDRMLARSRDAQVILLADAQTFCARPNGGSCAPIPVVTDTFAQYDAPVFSTNSLEIVLSTLDRDDPHGLIPGGWGARLRPDSLKVFIEISDEDAQITGARPFMSALKQRDSVGQYGFFAPQPNFVFHSVVGVEAPATGIPPEEEIEQFPCETAPNAGLVYQELSKQTGGLRFSVCKDPDYTKIFDTIADAEPQRVTPCAFIPSIQDEEDIDWSRVSVQVETGPGKGRVLTRASQQAPCGAGGEFTVTGDLVELCPQACEVFGADDSVDAISAVVGCVEEACVPSPRNECS